MIHALPDILGEDFSSRMQLIKTFTFRGVGSEEMHSAVFCASLAPTLGCKSSRFTKHMCNELCRKNLVQSFYLYKCR